MKIDLKEQNYIINNVKGFSFTEYLQLMKTKYELKEVLFRENDLHEDLKEFFIEFWDTIEKIDIKKAFQEQNQEKKRIYFHCIGPEKIFKNTKSKLLSTESVTKKRQNKEEYIDTYKLYSCDGKQFGLSGKIYYVNCFCPSTGREYFIFINNDFCEKRQWISNKGVISTYNKEIKAIDAISWTLRTNVKEEAVEFYYRQGDVLITKIKPQFIYSNYLLGRGTFFRPLTREEYLNKLIIET